MIGMIALLLAVDILPQLRERRDTCFVNKNLEAFLLGKEAPIICVLHGENFVNSQRLQGMTWETQPRNAVTAFRGWSADF